MARRRSWKSKATRLIQVDWRERALLAEAVVRLIAARMKIANLPFREIAKKLGTFVPATDPRIAEAKLPGPEAKAKIAREVGWAVTRAAEHVPFDAVCLPQAMAAHAMLRRRGIESVMHFGAKKSDEKPIDAHAWLDAAGVEVTGYPLSGGMTEIGAFV
ncbi:lasso peptide biosynthesis B2 protein [Sphingomonas sp. LB-2]|uniref:lasso peptide biosynthesis B2 protein n=1 Tax=Sphingomonas caeni TaxID=2984949 RepID=UPI00222EB7E0|nr:lasso peptide biosynthesis B2 protein [Sphingomonas caeni]MCW3846954.1 lasso peptide biosynthesis B2 protein [Sphingomonas caeni]